MAVMKSVFLVLAGLTCLECTKLKATNSPQTIETYGYSMWMSYLSNTYQTWTIETKDISNVVEVEIDMEIESSLACAYDSLQIFDGSSNTDDSLGIFCGSSTGTAVESSGRKIHVVFRSDYSVQMRGFKLEYKQVKDKFAIWMIVGIVLAVLITILSICLILFLCGVCKSKDQVSSIRLSYGQPQQPVWMTPTTQNHFQVVHAQFVPPPRYQDIAYPQAMELQEMNRGILPGTSDNEVPRELRDNVMAVSHPPRQHNEKT